MTKIIVPEGWALPPLFDLPLVAEVQVKPVDREVEKDIDIKRKEDKGALYHQTSFIDTLPTTEWPWPDVRDCRYIALDTETTGRDRFDPTHRIFSLSVACKKGSWYLPVRAQNGSPNMDEEKVFSWVQELMNDPRRQLIFFNAPFDLSMLRKEGIEAPHRFHDVMVLAHVSDHRNIKIGLKELARQEGYDTMAETAKDNYLKKHKEVANWSYLPNSLMEPYAKDDARLTYELFVRLYTCLDEDERHLYDVECDLTKTLFELECRGIRVDVDYLYQLADRYVGEINGLQRKLADYGVEPSKNETIARYIERAKLPVVAYTEKTKQIKTSKDVLAQYNDPVINAIEDYRRVSKLYSTYCVNLLSQQKEGIIHPNFWQTGTITGRLSGNMQQIPKENPEIRQAFIPRPGCALVFPDYAQQEIRLLAFYSRDPFLLQAYAADPNADVHQLVADMIHVKRSVAKQCAFAIIYGQGVTSTAKRLKISYDEAVDSFERFYGLLPGLKDFQERMRRRVEKEGRFKNVFGRTYYLGKDDERTYRGPNWLIQGTGGDMMKRAMVNLDRRFRAELQSTHLVLTIHDEIPYESQLEELQQSMVICKEVMEDMPMVDIPMVAEIKYTYSAWSEAKVWDGQI